MGGGGGFSRKKCSFIYKYVLNCRFEFGLGLLSLVNKVTNYSVKIGQTTEK